MGRDHLILGETTDYITGATVIDTHDERARQTIARILVDDKGYRKTDLETRRSLTVTVDGDSGTVRADYVVRLNNRAAMVLIYGPGAIVSRQRPALAIARLLEPYVIPYAVISNGREAYVMDSFTGKVIGKTLDHIFSRPALLSRVEDFQWQELSADRLEKEKRILFAMEVLSERECDEYSCSLK